MTPDDQRSVRIDLVSAPTASKHAAIVANIEIGLILLGLAGLCWCLPHAVSGDGAARLENLSRLLDQGDVQAKYPYSLLGPLTSAPLYWAGKAFGAPHTWCAYFNLLVLALGMVVLSTIMGRTDNRLLRRLLLLLLAASMFPHATRNYYGEMFSAVLVATGLFAIAWRKEFLGAVALILGVVNTPATLLGLGVVASALCLTRHRWRYLAIPMIAAGLILTENRIRRGDWFATGYFQSTGVRTLMPYSGLPGFSYPLWLGLLGVFFSFGKGLVYFTPGAFLPPRFGPSRPESPIRMTWILGLCFLAGMVLVYAKWWAWYGGWAWGPRFFLLASFISSLVLAHRLDLQNTTVMQRLLTILAVALSVWAAISGACFVQKNLEICQDYDYALEHLCWYVPEFSVLWRPFVVADKLSSGELSYATYCVLVFFWLTGPLLATTGRDLMRSATQQMQVLRAASWKM